MTLTVSADKEGKLPSVKHCPKCGGKTLISDSRIRYSKGAKIRRLARRRYCVNPECGHRHSTVEMPQREYDDLMRIRELLRKIAKESF